MKSITKRLLGWAILISLFLGLAIVLPAIFYGLKTALLMFGLATAITLLFTFSIKLINQK